MQRVVGGGGEVGGRRDEGVGCNGNLLPRARQLVAPVSRARQLVALSRRVNWQFDFSVELQVVGSSVPALKKWGLGVGSSGLLRRGRVSIRCTFLTRQHFGCRSPACVCPSVDTPFGEGGNE